MPISAAPRRSTSAVPGSGAATGPQMARCPWPSVMEIPPTCSRVRSTPGDRNRDPYRLGYHRRVVRDVFVVSQQKYERMHSERKRDLRFRLSGSEVQVVE